MSTDWNSIKSELIKQAPLIMCNQSRKVEYYVAMANNHRELARQWMDRREFEKAYICLMRYCNVAQSTLKEHKSWKTEKYARERKRVKMNLINAIEVLEKLTDRLKDKYDRPIEEDFMDKVEIVNENENEKEKEIVVEEKEKEKGVLVAEEEKEKGDFDRWANLKIPERPSSPKNSTGAVVDPEKISRHVGNLIKLEKVKVPLDLMEVFLKIAHPNTLKDVETCGILTGKLIGNGYQVTHLIIPRQEGSANTVVTYDEEKLIDVQIQYGLITLGWIHTHPSQTCFMSSVDLHTQYGYQVMIPEAIAIVMAPSKKKDSGIFSITLHGMHVLETCSKRGFHQHHEDEGIYREAEHAFFDSDCSSIQVFDLKNMP